MVDDTMALAPKSLTSASILVVGDIMLDRYWFGDVERISPEAPVPVVRVSATEERMGGAANVALNLVSIGARAHLLGVVGDDEPGRSLGKMMSDSGIAGQLLCDPKVPTTVKLRVIGRQQQLLRVDFEQAPEQSTVTNRFKQVCKQLDQVNVVVLSDYGKGALAQVEQIIEVSRALGHIVIVDPKGDDYDRYKGATVLTPNRAELREVVGRWRDEADLSNRAQKLRTELGLQYLLLTRSEDGMTVFTADGQWTVPAQAREVFDVSGAGDTVVAVLAGAMAAGMSMTLAVELANRAGSIVVSKLGTATVSQEELFAQ